MLLDSVPRYGYDCYLLLLTLKRQLWRYHHGSLWLVQVPVVGQLQIVLPLVRVRALPLLVLLLMVRQGVERGGRREQRETQT